VNRLFVVGCSFTRYHWPTWANIVGRSFDEYKNYAHSGIGNQGILERLNELVLFNNVGPGDNVIVQWTNPHRFDVHKVDDKIFRGWIPKGDIFNKSSGYDHSFIKTFWHEGSYVMHTCNYVTLGKHLLENVGCNWHFLSMDNLREDILRFSALHKYLEVFDDIDWLPPINNWFLESNLPKKTLTQPTGPVGILSPTRVKREDYHPTPMAHYQYAESFMKDKLNIELDKEWAQTAEDILFNDITSYTHVREIYIEKLGWDNITSCEKGL
jgi:hypothetical protein